MAVKNKTPYSYSRSKAAGVSEGIRIYQHSKNQPSSITTRNSTINLNPQPTKPNEAKMDHDFIAKLTWQLLRNNSVGVGLKKHYSSVNNA